MFDERETKQIYIMFKISVNNSFGMKCFMILFLIHPKASFQTYEIPRSARNDIDCGLE